MSDEAKATTDNTLSLPSEAEALASLREFAHGPIKHIFTWSEAAVVLELIETLTKGSMIEVSIRNPNVAEFMRHWEGRAEKAEATNAELGKALRWAMSGKSHPKLIPGQNDAYCAAFAAAEAALLNVPANA